MLVKTLIDFEGLQKGLPITPKGTILDIPDADALKYIGLGLMEPAPEAPQAKIAPQTTTTTKLQPENPPAAKGSGKKTHS